MPPSRSRPLPAAVLFDWDGTLVDTIPMIYRANVVALREFGITMSRDWYRERYTPDWRRSYRELGIPEDKWNDIAARWAQVAAVILRTITTVDLAGRVHQPHGRKALRKRR